MSIGKVIRSFEIPFSQVGFFPLTKSMGPVAQRITRLTTDQKIPGSNPGRIDFNFFFHSNLHNILLVRSN